MKLYLVEPLGEADDWDRCIGYVCAAPSPKAAHQLGDMVVYTYKVPDPDNPGSNRLPQTKVTYLGTTKRKAGIILESDMHG